MKLVAFSVLHFVKCKMQKYCWQSSKCNMESACHLQTLVGLVICDFLQQNLNAKCLLSSCFFCVVFFSSIFLTSNAAFQRCIMFTIFFVRWECEHGLDYELWTLCIDTRGHYNLVSGLILHNLQHNTAHLLPIMVLELLSFKVYMNNLYSNTTSTANGCLEAGSSCVLFAHFLMAQGEYWVLSKLDSSTISVVFSFFPLHIYVIACFWWKLWKFNYLWIFNFLTKCKLGFCCIWHPYCRVLVFIIWFFGQIWGGWLEQVLLWGWFEPFFRVVKASLFRQCLSNGF